MMYFNAFKDGLTKLPSADATVRQNLEQRGQQVGWPELHRELSQVDPVAGASIDPGNHQRIQRALEVYQITGIPISELWRNAYAEPVSERLNCNLVEFALTTVSREELHTRIESRLDDMLNSGFVDEVKGLRERWAIGTSTPSMRAVGYRQVGQFLDASARNDEPIDIRHSILVATRQLAKKQSTWLRGWRCLNGRDLLSADLEIMLQKLTPLP
jgi:tRNA dimethylallyltransferase